MTPDPLLAAFETATVDPATFHHREHLLVAWYYLLEMPLEAAYERYVRHLRALTAKLGVPEKLGLHVTWTYLARLAEAMRLDPGAPFETLIERVKRD